MRNKIKFFRDPVHDIIRVRDPFILELIDTVAFQRLRRIRQLGLAWIVYPGAEHSRFAHLLGAFHLAGRVMDQLNESSGKKLFNEEQRCLVLASALLHDLGHGPFSHMFEGVFKDLGQARSADHEEWTKRLIREDSQVTQVLRKVDSSFGSKICAILNHTHKPYYISALISSQLDVDRFDYLLRDAHMTGARYGNFDREWMLRTLSLAKVENTIEAMDDGSSSEKPPGVLSIVVDAKRGMSGLEQHILGRHYMYKHVYYHKTIRAAEGMLRMILKRAAILVKENRLEINNAGFRKLAKGKEMTADDYLSLHDFLILSWVDEWAHFAKDEILKDLSRRFISREIFGVIYPGNVTRKSYEDNREKVKNLLQKHTKNPDYYFIEDGPKDIAYKDLFDYREKEKSPQEIWYLDENGRPQPLTAFDGLLKQGKKALEFFEERWYLPRELKEKAMKLVQLKKGGQIT